jgi:hypothetical protein
MTIHNFGNILRKDTLKVENKSMLHKNNYLFF